MTRLCLTCKTDQPLDNFKPHHSASDGLRSQCDTCHAAKYLPWNRAAYFPKRGTIYLIRASNGLTKIGITGKIATRLRDIENSSPIPITLIFHQECDGANVIERKLHTMFQSHHDHAEWFNLTDEQINAAIDTIQKERHNV